MASGAGAVSNFLQPLAPSQVNCQSSVQDFLVKILLIVYVLTCMFLNYVVQENVFLTVGNLAEVFLLIAAGIVWLRKPIIHRWRGGRLEKRLATTLVVYLLIRIVLSYGTSLFVRHGVKLGLFVLLVFAYRTLGTEGRLFPFMAWLLPSAYAVAVAFRLVVLAFSGELGAVRLEMPPYTHEYVGIMAGLMVGFLIYLWTQRRTATKTILLSLITVFLLLGLFLSAVRGGLLAAAATSLCYLLFSGQSVRRIIIIVFGITVVVLSFSWVYTLETPNQGSRLDVVSFDPTMTGRTLIWADTLRQVVSSPKRFFFGFGLGGFTVDLPEVSATGRYDWDSVKEDPFNGFLAAWGSLGLVGMFAYGFLWYCLWRRIRTIRSRRYRVLLLSWFLGMALADLFNTHFQQTRTNWLNAYLVALFAFSAEEPAESGQQQSSRAKVPKIRLVAHTSTS